MLELRYATPEEIAEWDSAPALEWIDTEDLCESTGEPHDWQPINTPRGRAWRCETCWDRTD